MDELLKKLPVVAVLTSLQRECHVIIYLLCFLQFSTVKARCRNILRNPLSRGTFHTADLSSEGQFHCDACCVEQTENVQNTPVWISFWVIGNHLWNTKMKGPPPPKKKRWRWHQIKTCRPMDRRPGEESRIQKQSKTADISHLSAVRRKEGRGKAMCDEVHTWLQVWILFSVNSLQIHNWFFFSLQDPITSAKYLQTSIDVTRQEVEEYFGLDGYWCECYAWNSTPQSNTPKSATSKRGVIQIACEYCTILLFRCWISKLLWYNWVGMSSKNLGRRKAKNLAKIGKNLQFYFWHRKTS